MNYIIWVGVAAVIVAAILVFIKIKKDKNIRNENNLNSEQTLIEENEHELCEINYTNDFIQIEELSADNAPNTNNLVEITDKKVLAHIDNIIPSIAQSALSIGNAAHAMKSGSETLYKAIIPAGTKLANSKSMQNAQRGIYFKDGKIGNANFKAVKPEKGKLITPNYIASVVSVASMIVGEYYMGQIQKQLENISDEISKISQFQDNEFKSRVFSLVLHVKEISNFQVEIIENNELRLSKLSQLDGLEEECTKLLGQTNLTLEEYAKKSDLKYEQYEKEVRSADEWVSYQEALLKVLYNISELRFTLYQGSTSREQCSALLQDYNQLTYITNSKLEEWTHNNIIRLKIDVENESRKRSGFDGLIHKLPGLFNKELNYRTINNDTAKMIQNQSTMCSNEMKQDNSNLYSKDVQLIFKDGKVFYLPN